MGLSFTVTFPHVFHTSTVANARELPLFANPAGNYNVVVTSVIQTFIERRTLWSQVCIAEVRIDGEAKGKVALKILQPWLLHIPQYKSEDPLG